MKKLIISFALIFVTFIAILTGIGNTHIVHANSAQREWYGVDSGGIFSRDEECPLLVEKEDLDFYINDSFSYTDTNSSYSYVSAKYTFYNPEDYEIKAKVVFPFTESGYNAVEDSNYQIKTNDIVLEKKYRFVYGSFSTFNANNDIAKIKDDYDVKDGNADRKLYSYIINVPKYNGRCLIIPVKEPSNLFFVGGGDYFYKKSTLYLSINLSSTSYINIILNNDNIDSILNDAMIYDNENLDTLLDNSPEISFKSKEEKTYFDVVMTYHTNYTEISEIDWYNAFNEYLDENNNVKINSLDISNGLMKFYEYELDVPAKSRVINEVTAPLYPDENRGYTPAKYTYTYLLSPASTWKEFSNLTIKIHTDAYLLNATYQKSFTKNDGYYLLTSDTLPEKELTFTLCMKENPSSVSNGYTGLIILVLIVCAGFLAVSVFGLVTLISYLLSLKKYQGNERGLFSIAALKSFLASTITFITGILLFRNAIDSNTSYIIYYVSFAIIEMMDVYMIFKSKKYLFFMGPGVLLALFIISCIFKWFIVYTALITAVYSFVFYIIYKEMILNVKENH